LILAAKASGRRLPAYDAYQRIAVTLKAIGPTTFQRLLIFSLNINREASLLASKLHSNPLVTGNNAADSLI
jgi:hypothetical protein